MAAWLAESYSRRTSAWAASVIRTRSVLIEPSDVGPHPPPAHADGELVGQLPLRIEVVPGAVRLLG